MIQYRHPRPRLVVARAGVDEHRQPVHLDDPDLHGDSPAAVVPVGRLELAVLAPGFLRRKGEHLHRQVVDLSLDDAGERRVAEADAVRCHGLILMWPGEYSPLRVAVPRSSCGSLGFDDCVELAQRTPVAAPVLRQVRRHHMGAQQQVTDAEQTAVETVLPGIGVLALGVVVRRDPELGDLGDAVGVQHRLLARERHPDRPVHQDGLIRADVLLHRPQLRHPRRGDRDPVARRERNILGHNAYRDRVGGNLVTGESQVAPRRDGPEVVGHQSARGNRRAVRSGKRVLQFDRLPLGPPVEHAVAGDGARSRDDHKGVRVLGGGS